MEWTRLFVLVALGLLLLAGNVGYFNLVRRSLSPGEAPQRVAPFHVLGDGVTPEHGTTLAHMLVARLGDIEQRMRRVQAALAASRGDAATSLRQDRLLDQEHAVPTVFVPLDLDVKVGGIEVGGLFAWVQRQLARDSMLQVSVHLGEAGGRVGGNWIDQENEPFWAEVTETSHDAIVDAVAFQIAYRTFVGRVPEANALTAVELQLLLDELIALVDLKLLAASGRLVEEEEYAAVLDRVWELVSNAPAWGDLQLLAADIAEHAADKERAALLYRRALAATEQEPRIAELREKIETLEAELVAESTFATAGSNAGETTDSGSPPSDVAAEAGYGALPEDLPSLETVRRQLGVDDLQMAREVWIALPGVPSVVDRRDQVLGGRLTDGSTSEVSAMSEYVDNVARMVRVVAPRARFVFGPFSYRGSGGTSEMVRVARTLMRSPRAPRILLLPYGPLPPSEFVPLFREVAELGGTSVVTAGNASGKPVLLDGSREELALMVAAATDLDGRIAGFSQYGPGCVWAPGATLPTRIENGRVRAESGTAYSAALAAGVAARVVAELPRVPGTTLVATLQAEAEPFVDGGPPVLRLDRTVQALRRSP